MSFMWASEPMILWSFQQQGIPVMAHVPLETFMRQVFLPSAGVELPGGYQQAWTNGSEFVLSNDPRFDPAGVGRGGWTRMERDDR